MMKTLLKDVFRGLIPLVGDYLDWIFNANEKNLAIFDRWLKEKYIPELMSQNIKIPPELKKIIEK